MMENMVRLTRSSMRVKPCRPPPARVISLPFQVRHDGDGSRPSPLSPRNRDLRFAQPQVPELGCLDLPSEVSILLRELTRRGARGDRAFRLQFPEPRLDERQSPCVLGGVLERVE